MPIYRTENNRVAADEPEPDDTHLQIITFGPSEDGRCRIATESSPLPIDRYDATVDWALKMADQMVYPIYILPLSAVQVLRLKVVQDGIANLSAQQEEELRQEVITGLKKIMWNSDDKRARADAYELLVDMKVVKP